jgi:tetratricopeptide (TPR) repeat protein
MADTDKHTLTIQQALDLGVEHHKARRLREAEAIYTQILQVEPNQPIALHLLGVVAHQAGKADIAIDLITKALTVKPDFAEALSNLGIVHANQGNFREAITHYNKALTLSPDLFDGHVNLGWALFAIGKVQDAVASYETALSICQVDTAVLNNLGHALRSLGRLDEATDTFQSLVNLEPENADAHNSLGNVLRDRGDLERAIDSYQKSYVAAPDFAIARHNHGSTLLDIGLYQEAIDVLKNSSHQLSRSSLLECLYAIGEKRKFYQELKNIITIDKKNLGVSAISSFAAHQFDCTDPYPFCSNPMDFISTGNILESTGNNGDFLKSVQDQITELGLGGGNQSLLHAGFQSTGTLFSDSHGLVAELENALKNEIEAYFSKYAGSDCLFVKLRPKEYVLTGWYIAMEKGGHLDWHNHPSGWLSGVLYFNVPTKSADEANIEFALHGDKLPIHRSGQPRQKYPIAEGNFIFFPSSLFHRTVPFYAGDTRFCVAFDVAADQICAN